MTEIFETTPRPRWYHVDERSAMYVKLIDNTYRDAVFALANYYVVLADAYDLPESGSRLVRIAEDDYKNQMYLPGPVGGKCLTKDSHFLTGEWTPDEYDLFGDVRGIQDDYYGVVVDHVLNSEPDSVAILGTAFKPEVGNEVASPGLRLRDRFEEAGIDVSCFDPHVPRGESATAAVSDADLTVLAINHDHFAERESEILAAADGQVLDLWGQFADAPDVIEP